MFFGADDPEEENFHLSSSKILCAPFFPIPGTADRVSTDSAAIA
jgi:hypothetical protein